MSYARSEGRARFAPRGATIVQASLTILGICLFRLSAWSIFGSSYLGATDEAFMYSRLAQLASTLLIMAVSLKTARLPRALPSITVAAATLVMVVCSLLCMGRPGSDPLFITARIAHGAASSVLILGWGAHTCATEPRLACTWTALAFSLYGIATFALQGAPSGLTDALMVVSPLASGLMLLPCIARHSPEPARPVERGRNPLPRSEWGPILLLLACSVVCSITAIFITVDYTGITTYTSNVFRLVSFCVIAAIFCIWTYVLKRDDPDRLWPVFSCVIFFGLLGYSSFSFANQASSTSFMQATQDCLMLFAWVYVSGLAYRQGLPRIFAFGLGTILYMRTDLPATIIHRLVPGIGSGTGEGAAVALSFAMAAVLIVYTIVLLCRPSFSKQGPAGNASEAPSIPRPSSCVRRTREARQETGKRKGEPTVAGAGTVGSGPRRDLSWLDAFSLTAREVQVVDLLLRGHTLPSIGERLGVSLNTARWYAKNIYRKLGIHRKTELIALAEQDGGGVLEPTSVRQPSPRATDTSGSSSEPRLGPLA